MRQAEQERANWSAGEHDCVRSGFYGRLRGRSLIR